MRIIYILTTVVYLLSSSTTRAEDDTDKYMQFPPGFMIGAATASHQIEGAWNTSDKSVNVWDFFTHNKPWKIADRSNADVACDSYHKYKEDIRYMKDLGLDHYRFSFSWSRILPSGFANKVSKDGINYYKNVLDELKLKGIEPLVTLYHWDHPQILEEMGGWTNELMVQWFADYARVVFQELGDRIKLFATINEPYVICQEGYGSAVKAPGKSIDGVGPYLCVHNMIKAHAKVYNIYNDEFRPSQRGKLGIVLPCGWSYPKNPSDTESPEIYFQFECGWMAHPLFSVTGDYPEIMKQRIAENSKLEGLSRSRLPKFTKAEVDYNRGTADFFGLNHYTSVLVEAAPKTNSTRWYNDKGIITSFNASWPSSASEWLKVVPMGIGDTLRKIKTTFNNPLLYITENGYSDTGATLMDFERIDYFHDYLREVLLAVNRDDCNIKGYTMWSIMDNFEWSRGYTERFGIISVDFKKPDRPRTPKLSYSWFKELLRTRKLVPSNQIVG